LTLPKGISPLFVKELLLALNVLSHSEPLPSLTTPLPPKLHASIGHPNATQAYLRKHPRRKDNRIMDPLLLVVSVHAQELGTSSNQGQVPTPSLKRSNLRSA